MPGNTEQSRISSIQQKLASVSSIISLKEGQDALCRGSRQQVENWLQAEAKTLIHKQQRYLEKQLRLKQIEEQYEHARDKKQQDIQQKLIASSHNKTRNLEKLQKKLLGVAKQHHSIICRHKDQESRQLDQLYSQRQSFSLKPDYKVSSRARSSRSRKSEHQTDASAQDDHIARNMQEISERLEKAKSTNDERRASEVSRANHHNTTQLQQVLQRGQLSFLAQQSAFQHKIASQLAQATQNQLQHQMSVEKQIEQRQKAYSTKLKACQENLRQIENQQASKLDQLQKKNQQNRGGEKSWKDERRPIYMQRFLANLSLLEEEKVSRADKIIEKHQEIRDRNRVYKQRKDSLVKAIKCNPLVNAIKYHPAALF